MRGPNEVIARRPRHPSRGRRPPARAWPVVARIERVPAPFEVDLEPGSEVHRFRGRGDGDVGDVAEDVAGGNVQRPAEGDREMGEVPAHALAGAVGVRGRRPWIRGAGHEHEDLVDVVDDRLHPPPPRRQPAEALPRLVTKLVRQAEAARHDEPQDVVRHNVTGTSAAAGSITSANAASTTGPHTPPAIRPRELEALAAIAVAVEVAVVIGARLPPLAADRDAGLQVWGDLHDRARRLR